MPTQLSTTQSRLFKPKRAGTTRRSCSTLSRERVLRMYGVGFDGESDQGQVRATASADGKGVGFPPLVLTLHISKFGSTELTSREFRLQDAYSPVSPAFPAWLQFWLYIRMPSSAFSIGDFAMMISSPPTIHIARPRHARAQFRTTWSNGVVGSTPTSLSASTLSIKFCHCRAQLN
jgi:hypothetical protein